MNADAPPASLKKPHPPATSSGNNLFWPSILIAGSIAVWGAISPTGMHEGCRTWVQWFFNHFGWWYVWMPFSLLICCIYLACSRFGKIRLGGDAARPEFSDFSWLSMLFTAGIGVGLVFFGVAEPVIHYYSGPSGVLAGTAKAEAARFGMMETLFEWGFAAWSTYAAAGLVVGYYAFNRGARFLPGEPIRLAFHNKPWANHAAKLTNILAPPVAALTMAGSIGMGTFQMTNGLRLITGEELSGYTVPLLVLFVIFCTYAIPASTPLKKGMKRLGDWNIYLALFIFMWAFVFGPTTYLMETMVTTLGDMLRTTVSFNFNVYMNEEESVRQWFNDWPMTIWAWWVSWTPFMGVFVARISYGRTIRQFVLASIIVPTLCMLVWFSTFGGLGIFNDILGDGSIAATAMQDWSKSFFSTLEYLPLPQITAPVTMILVLLFLATGACAAAISLAIMTSDGKHDAPPGKAFIWAVIMAAVGMALTIIDSMEAVKAILSFLAIPYTFLLLLSVAGLFRGLKTELRTQSQSTEINHTAGDRSSCLD